MKSWNPLKSGLSKKPNREIFPVCLFGLPGGGEICDNHLQCHCRQGRPHGYSMYPFKQFSISASRESLPPRRMTKDAGLYTTRTSINISTVSPYMRYLWKPGITRKLYAHGLGMEKSPDTRSETATGRGLSIVPPWISFFEPDARDPRSKYRPFDRINQHRYSL